MSFFICHSVLQKSPVSLLVTLLFCLQKTSVSLRHSVILSSKKTSVSFRHSVILSSKKTSVSLRHSVILSSKKHLSPFVIMSFCLQKSPVSLSVTMLFCLKKPQLGTEAGPAVVVIVTFLSVLYQYFISSATSSPTTFLQYILFYKVVEVTCCGILRTVSYLVPLRGSQLPFKTIEEHVKHLSLSVV